MGQQEEKMNSTAMSQQAAASEAPSGSVSQGNILLMLYDGAIRFVDLAKGQIEEGNRAAKEVSLGKAYAIISEFINSLDYEQAPDLCSNLQKIYEFMLAQLTQANTSMDAKPLDTVLCHLKDMRRTWSEAVANVSP
jgi:flagellar secretion chaperone FliS